MLSMLEAWAQIKRFSESLHPYTYRTHKKLREKKETR